jgi:hypothetical protein
VQDEGRSRHAIEKKERAALRVRGRIRPRRAAEGGPSAFEAGSAKELLLRREPLPIRREFSV